MTPDATTARAIKDERRKKSVDTLVYICVT